MSFFRLRNSEVVSFVNFGKEKSFFSRRRAFVGIPCRQNHQKQL